MRGASRMEGGSFSNSDSRPGAAHVRLKILKVCLTKSQQFQTCSWLTSQKRCFGAMSECQGARSGVLARFRVVKNQQ
eukprot:9476589-Pyramimonas_sp.AAC.1